MGLRWFWMSAATLLACYILAKVVRNLNGWYYDLKLRNKPYPLPPGDMGWPFLGKLLAFFKDFSSGHPDSFINAFVQKYGRTGIYKTHLFGNPSIIVCTAEMCKRVLADDVNFKLGYPKSTLELVQSKRLHNNEHKRFRRLVTAPIVGHNVLAAYIERIEDIVVNALEELSSMKHPVELFKEMKKVSFTIIIHIFLGSIDEGIVTKFGDLFNLMSIGLFSLPIKAPGFAFNKALKARTKLAKMVQSIIDERRLMIKNGQIRENKDSLDMLLQLNGENGEKLMDDRDIIDFLMVLLFAGHETAATGMMWSIIYLTQHPHYLKKAKEEQEEIMKARPSSQKYLSLKEIKQMVYLSQVINETLRRTSFSFAPFREATTDLNINGYLIPKGWKVLVWLRSVHMDPEYHSNPDEFIPSRFDDYNANAGTFLPFGAGSRLCPGSDLARLEISIYLHHFLLNYKLEQINPDGPITNLPIPKPVDNCLAKVIKCSSHSA